MEHECINEKELKRLSDENAALRIVANSHVSWTVFWSIVLLLVMVFSAVVASINSDNKAEHTKIEEDVANQKEENNESKIAYATIQTQLSQIQKDLAELKLRK